MADIRQITQVGDSILREKAVTVRRFDDKLGRLLEDMLMTMDAAKGIGLAAPQIGISKRIAVVRDGEEDVLELVNPVILTASGREEEEERCLSVPGRGGLVPRATKITLEFQDREGNTCRLKAKDYLARVIQHELDHLDGRLFIDIMTEEILD